MQPVPSEGNCIRAGRIGFGFGCHWLKVRRHFGNQLQSEVNKTKESQNDFQYSIRELYWILRLSVHIGNVDC